MRPRKVFAIGRGQFENIGDVILRRQLLDWVRETGELHVYVGSSPAGYDEGLGLGPDDRVYRSLRAWYRVALTSALRGGAAYVFKPGEIQLTLAGLKEHLSALPLLLALRLRGGAAVRAGVGTRNFAPVPRALMRPSIALSDLTLWRDDATGAYMGTGEVMPDLAFGEGADDDAVASFSVRSPERDVLVVSMRGDEASRPHPSDAWLAGVRAYAAQNALTIWAVTQVRTDDARTVRLAADLGGRALTWPESTPHDEQERRLRELYSRTAVVISDRLHVLIAAFTEGAVPVGASVEGSDKVDRHFATIGLHGVSIPAGSGEELTGRLKDLADRRAEMFGRLLEARTRLRVSRDRIRDVVRGADRPTVHHLGRVGDIPGGMTQVLNGYVAWDFPRVDVAIITSRGNPHDLRAAALKATGALVRVLRLPRRRSVVVAHLSERGSFVREGFLLRVAHRRGIATVAHLHGSSFATFAARHPRLTGWALLHADRVITLSAETSEVSARFVPADRVVLIPNAIPSSSPTEKDPLVVFGGVVSHRKGIDVLQEAWSRIDAPGWELVVAGPVREAHLVREGIPGMRLVGSLAHEELMALLDRSQVAVLPSRDEAMPMFILEAMARSNCVISTDVGGIAAVLGEGRGIVVPPADVDAFHTALQSVLSDGDRRAQLAAAGKAAFEERFSAAAVFPRLEQLWLDALADRRAS
ncbi:glycosyltransferase family 4 protein [Candidatus Blastococcus massiliensis]|uniref:glycosyltransferase family 4 protein n=1 Tax=Candidatus Blastococcus massiliensis TaxID=1470358 RepID=UPI0004AD7BD2|nr:glycosyltransferase family 4 protein [Candidatus Blastococcus massiliensis]